MPIPTPPRVTLFQAHNGVYPRTVTFAYQEGEQLIGLVQRLQNYLIEYLTPYIDGNSETLIAAVNEALSLQNSAFNVVVQQIIDDSIELQDPVLAAIVADDDSEAGAYLRTIFANKATQQAVESGRLSEKSLDERYGYAVNIERFYLPEDNDDWALALHRGLAYTAPLGVALHLSRMYPIRTNKYVAVDNAHITGNGHTTGLYSPTNAAIHILRVENKVNITLSNFTVDGGIASTYVDSGITIRPIRFRSCQHISLDRMNVINAENWGTSFEQSRWIKVTNHTHTRSAYNVGGGHDGVHFLDCSDFLLDGALIYSRDDCVSITSETTGSYRGRILNVVGHSTIAAVVTLGGEGGSTFGAEDMEFKNISTHRPAGTTEESQYIIKLQALNGSTVRQMTVSGVQGKSRNYAIWLDGNSSVPMAEVSVTDFDVTSLEYHGFRATNVDQFIIQGKARSNGGNFDGFSISGCTWGSLSVVSRQSSLWGIQLAASSRIDLLGCHAKECGSYGYSNSNGGGMKIGNNCSNINVIGGAYGGAGQFSYFGIYDQGIGTTYSGGTARLGVTGNA